MIRRLFAAAAIAAAAIGAAPSASADPYGDLWRMVPQGYGHGSCQPTEAGVPIEDPGAVALIECTSNSLPGGPILARYTLFRDVTALNDQFAHIYGHSEHFEARTCPGMPGFPIRWTGPDGQEAGSVACGLAEGDVATVMWTNDSGPLLAVAMGPDLAALFEWWSAAVEGTP